MQISSGIVIHYKGIKREHLNSILSGKNRNLYEKSAPNKKLSRQKKEPKKETGNREPINLREYLRTEKERETDKV